MTVYPIHIPLGYGYVCYWHRMEKLKHAKSDSFGGRGVAGGGGSGRDRKTAATDLLFKVNNQASNWMENHVPSADEMTEMKGCWMMTRWWTVRFGSAALKQWLMAAGRCRCDDLYVLNDKDTRYTLSIKVSYLSSALGHCYANSISARGEGAVGLRKADITQE